MANAYRMGQIIQHELKALPGIVELRGLGLMLGLDLPHPVAHFRKKLLLQHHVFTGSSSIPETIRLLPALTVSENEVRSFCQTFSEAIQETANNESVL